MIKPKLWNGKDLEGVWILTYKLDGVRVLVTDGEALSRSKKPLYNVPPHLPDGDYEMFFKDWETSVSMLRTKDGEEIDIHHFHSLSPPSDSLRPVEVVNPTSWFINTVLGLVVEEGYEGLVLRQGNKWLKVKPSETYDVPVIGMVEGTGKYKGKMGALITEMGKVGTGFTDADREVFFPMNVKGLIIEVECMSLTPAGKFRHPRFKRVRWDK